MRRFMPHLWAGTALLAALLTCSCQHHRCCCSNCHAPCAGTMASFTAPATAVAVPAQTNVAKSSAVSSQAPVVHTTAKQHPFNPQQNQDSAASLSESSENAQTPALERFGHDPNYRWLVGTLDYSRIQQAWLLRYVPYEEDDRYGGCVTLVGALPAKSLKSGQTVRVEGALIDPESRQLRPAFQVQNLRALGL
jgi:hypothetical protein